MSQMNNISFKHHLRSDIACFQHTRNNQKLSACAGSRAAHKRTRIVCQIGPVGFDEQGRLSDVGKKHMIKAAEVACLADGLAAPHPRAGCVLVGPDGRVLSETFQMGQGGLPAQILAARAAGERAQGGTAFLNLEPSAGMVAGGDREVEALVQAGIKHAVIGLKHPVPSLRGNGIAALKAAGIQVSALGCAMGPSSAGACAAEASRACMAANEALLHRAVTGRPLSVLKYAMTLDGKIATHKWHSAWVSCAESRQRVFAERSRSDAIIVGGNTCRQDGPRLTTRREDGHVPMRVVMSRCLDLPDDAPLWDTSVAPTLVMTQKGARKDFQQQLRDKGVEVVEFDFLSPGVAADYLAQRGCLRLLWECGGTLAAPAVSDLAIHKVMAFIAPKLIGGENAPTPLNSLGFVEMTQSLNLVDVKYEQVGCDLLTTGYLPASGGLPRLATELEAGGAKTHSLVLGDPQAWGVGGRLVWASAADKERTPTLEGITQAGDASPSSPSWDEYPQEESFEDLKEERSDEQTKDESGVSELDILECRFYKAWDAYGPFSNFAPFPIMMKSTVGEKEEEEEWPTVEHFYQAQKFAGMEGSQNTVDTVRNAPTPELAAWYGRRAQRNAPRLVRPDWDMEKQDVMRSALRAKFSQHPGLRQLLLSTATLQAPVLLLEDSPHDYIWGVGLRGSGINLLGEMLAELRGEFIGQDHAASEQ